MGVGTVRNDARRSLWRSRWAAIGAAVAVSLGGGGLFVANAASSPASSVVTIDPVRILDTRTNVGLSGPFVSLTPRKLQVTGAAVPAGATGVLLNVTVVAPAAAGFLSVRPGDATGAPSTSSLNFEAGDIVPNAVQVGLPTSGANAGKIDIMYDAFGVPGPTTNVLIDVVGYMVAGGGGATDQAVVLSATQLGLVAGQNACILGPIVPDYEMAAVFSGGVYARGPGVVASRVKFRADGGAWNDVQGTIYLGSEPTTADYGSSPVGGTLNLAPGVSYEFSVDVAFNGSGGESGCQLAAAIHHPKPGTASPLTVSETEQNFDD